MSIVMSTAPAHSHSWVSFIFVGRWIDRSIMVSIGRIFIFRRIIIELSIVYSFTFRNLVKNSRSTLGKVAWGRFIEDWIDSWEGSILTVILGTL